MSFEICLYSTKFPEWLIPPTSKVGGRIPPAALPPLRMLIASPVAAQPFPMQTSQNQPEPCNLYYMSHDPAMTM